MKWLGFSLGGPSRAGYFPRSVGFRCQKSPRFLGVALGMMVRLDRLPFQVLSCVSVRGVQGASVRPKPCVEKGLVWVVFAQNAQRLFW